MMFAVKSDPDTETVVAAEAVPFVASNAAAEPVTEILGVAAGGSARPTKFCMRTPRPLVPSFRSRMTVVALKGPAIVIVPVLMYVELLGVALVALALHVLPPSRETSSLIGWAVPLPKVATRPVTTSDV